MNPTHSPALAERTAPAGWDQALSTAFILANQKLGLVILDLFWKSVWGVVSAIGMTMTVIFLIGQIGATEWEGPELGPADPILLLSALDGLWSLWSTTVFSVLFVALLASAGLWLVLEALCRGGLANFWIYLGSGAGRSAVLGAAALVLGTLVSREEDRTGAAVIACVVILVIWFMVAVIETVIRRDAIDLVARDLPSLIAAMGCLLAIQAGIAALFGGFTAAVFLSAGTAAEMWGAMAIGAMAVAVWVIVHSYLIVVRFITVDILRRSLVDG